MSDFLFGLNTSTIQPASLLEKVRIAQQAGYDAIELWITDVEDFLERGGRLSEAIKAVEGSGLARPSMIYLKGWCEQNPTYYAKALDLCRRRLEIAQKLGVRRMVAGPPPQALPQSFVAERYSKLLDISVAIGVPASLEFLGFVLGVSTIEVAWDICGQVNHPQATITNDAWHLFRGGSSDATLDEIPAERISIVHWDDAPPQPDRTQQTDAHRVMPGDGVLPLATLAAQLRRIGYRGVLSLELFNRDYWKQDPLEVARTGLAKMKHSVER